MKRALCLPGTTNFRDLGGYATTCGRRVREGVVFRSDSLHHVPPAVAQEVLVDRLHLTHSFDFRSPDEVHLKPYSFSRIEHVLVPIGGSMVEKLREPGAKVTPEYMRELVHATYRDRIDNYSHQLAQVLQFLTSTDFGAEGRQQSIVFHCTAGKDRTGLMAAIILHLVGVPRDTILEDYMLTSACLKRPTDAHYYYDATRISDTAIDVIWGIDSTYLNEAFDYMKRRYGGVDAYVTEKLKIDAEAVQRLRARLLV
ncbi:hypothetical protein LSCM1_01017 [Leishmania martiniquensis]|uniref:Tyrosine specific protein phosphatases domain-containing protein n=1 Tax=Leishmania martiniquensis TaxID=1580590 RepID=A0A836GXY6_9TRYP|nr:hypothetical protein LSCM1_01017 [Leishmania martiniquensis]